MSPTPRHQTQAVFNLFGSAWNQGRRTYAPVRGKNGSNSNGNGNDNGNDVGGDDAVPSSALGGDAGVVGVGVVGKVKASDCHHLLLLSDREGVVKQGTGRDGAVGVGGAAEPRYERIPVIFFLFGCRSLTKSLRTESLFGQIVEV